MLSFPPYLCCPDWHGALTIYICFNHIFVDLIGLVPWLYLPFPWLAWCCVWERGGDSPRLIRWMPRACVVIMCAMDRFPSRYNVEWPESHVSQCAMERYPRRYNVVFREAHVFSSLAPWNGVPIAALMCAPGGQVFPFCFYASLNRVVRYTRMAFYDICWYVAVRYRRAHGRR